MTEWRHDAQGSCGISRKRLDSLLDGFVGRRVLVVGDLMLDEYIWGQTSRVSPEAPVLVLDVQRTTHTPGGAANVARNVREMGGEVMVAGVVGTDSNADLLLSALQTEGCVTEGVVVAEERCTTVKSRVVAHNQQVVRIDREWRKPIGRVALKKLSAFADAIIPTVDAVILSDYAKGVLADELVAAIIKKAKKCHVPLAANLKPPRTTAFRGATLLTLNLTEAERAWEQPIVNEGALYRCGRVLHKRLACKGLLITRGGDGVALFIPAGAPLAIPARRVSVFDVSGAGDTVISAATLALSAGATLGEAAAIGNLAGNIKVTKLGTAPVTCHEIRQFAREKPSEAP